jgi:CBS domain-containing protein
VNCGRRLAVRVKTMISQQAIRSPRPSGRPAGERVTTGCVALPVIKGNELVGIISERDLHDALVDGSNPSTALISGYLTSASYAGPEDGSSDLALRKLNFGVRHLSVVEAGQVIGMGVGARPTRARRLSPGLVTAYLYVRGAHPPACSLMVRRPGGRRRLPFE